jgi:hypothetical protein
MKKMDIQFWTPKKQWQNVTNEPSDIHKKKKQKKTLNDEIMEEVNEKLLDKILDKINQKL